MITKIKGKGFLGPDIDCSCSNKMFVTGPNRSGKTTKTNIIHLVLNGFIASAHRVCKKPSDILEQYSAGNQITCSVEIDGKTEFEYHISKDSKGSVSKRLRVDKKKYPEKEFMQELTLSGNPKIIDLSSFIQLSDDKKIDQLFKIYPGDVDIQELNSNISKKEAAINMKTADIKTKEAVITENNKSKQLIELPSGSLSSIRAEIEDCKIAYRGTRDKITELKAKEKKIVEPDPIPESNTLYNQEADLPSGTFAAPIAEKPVEILHISTRLCAEMFENILHSMSKTDCSMCVASMMIKKYLKDLNNG